MVMNYGSLFYVLMLVLLAVLTVGTWLILRRCSEKTQRIAVLVLMLLNVAQHLFKPLIYPMYWGQGFTHIMTAYNMCATLILLSPVAMLCKSRLLKNFVFFVGCVAAVAAVAVPVWYIGKDVSDLGWDYVRFYLCHALLLITSMMPLVLGMHAPAFREWWHIGTGFLLALCVILVNDFVMMTLGMYPGADISTFYQSMLKINPCGLMGPPQALPWVEKLVRLLSPPVFMGENPTGLYVPILWYAIPLFVGISIGAVILFWVLDKKNLRSAPTENNEQ